MKIRTLAAAGVIAVAALTGATHAADTFAFTLDSAASSATYNFNAAAPVIGTMVGDTAATPPTRTKTGTIRFIPFGVNCGTFGETQNDPLNISGAIAAAGTGSNIRPTGAFTLSIDPVAGTSLVQGLSLNLLGTSSASVTASLNNFTYPTFCAVNPTCGVPFLIPITLPLGSLVVTSMTAAQGPGNAAGTLTAAAGGGWDFAIPMVLTVTAAANFGGTPFPIDPQAVPVVFSGRIIVAGDTATVTSMVNLNLAPPGVTTPTPLPPTPLTIPAGTGLCDGANLILALTLNSSTVSVATTADITAGGGRVRCPCDWNNSGAVTVQDIFDFLGSYFAGSGDFNGAGGTTVQDIFDFLACYFGPPSPPC